MGVFSLDGTSLSKSFNLSGEVLSEIFNLSKASSAEDENITYVKDGLALWLDGIDNGGEGVHLTDLTEWKDLSGNGCNFALNDVTATDKAVCFNGSSSYGRISNDNLATLLTGLKERTVEVVCKLNNTSNVQVIFLGLGNTGVSNGSAGLWYRPASSGFKVTSYSNKPVPVSDNITEACSYSIVFGNSDSNDYSFYQNGNAMSLASSATGTMANLTATTIGARLYSGSYGYFMNGEIYSIRVYDRQLTESERLQNLMLDRKRFGISLPYDMAVMSFNVQRWTGINSQEAIMSAIFEKYNPDIAGFQEYDTVRTPSSTLGIEDYLKSYWDYLQVGECTVTNFSKALASHHKLSGIESKDFTNSNPSAERRSYNKCYIDLGDKKIAIFNIHLDVSASKNSDGVQYKVLQSQELCDLVSQEEYFILMGDFNTICLSTEDSDYTNQVKPFIDAGFNVVNCNPDRFGFMPTYTAGTTEADTWYPCDNIITSANINIVTAEVDKSKIEADTGLTLDHMPLIAYLRVN